MKKKIKSKNELPFYTAEEEEKIEAFIEKNYGKIRRALEETDPKEIRLKFCIIPPDRKKHCYTVVTMGMGAHEMTVTDSKGIVIRNRAELVFSLPPEWNTESFDNEDFWPFTLTEIIAKMPVKDGTWLAQGHTISFDTNFADSTQFCGALLVVPPNGEDARSCNLGNNEVVRFYQVIPLYRREIDYKNKFCSAALIDLLNENSYIIDTERPCVVSDDLMTRIDCLYDHSRKITEKDLDTDEINGANHISAYLLWMIKHGMINKEISEFFAEELASVKSGKTDVRDFFVKTLGGELTTELFNEEGLRFTDMYYNFYSGGISFPADVDRIALKHFGEELYNCEEFGDEAYLFVPYDKKYLSAMSRTISKAYKSFKNNEFPDIS